MSAQLNLSPKHLLFALMVVVVWGLNFIAIYVGLQELPPFLFCTIRFALSALPLVFFLPKPKAPLLTILGFGLFNFALQFGLMFSGIALGMSPGLASLVVQVQVFFSIGLAYVLFKEKPSLWKIIGSLISFIGLGLVASHVGGDVTLIGLILTVLAALSWALGNIFTKKINADSPLALVVWGNLVALPFMAIASLIVDGPSLIVSSLQNISWITIGAILYVVFFATHLAYGLWAFLLSRYSTTLVVPYTLLIPVIGFLSTAFFLGEELSTWKLTASAFILSGLVFNLFEKRILKLFGRG